MNLSEADIRKALEKYMESHNVRGYEMAKLCGMSSPSMFSQYLSGVTKTLRAEYLLNFIFNTKTDLNLFLGKNTYEKQEEIQSFSDQAIKYYNCPECIAKQREIDELKEYRQKYIECLEELAGKKKAAS